MKYVLLSMKPSGWDLIRSGEKIYEYRKRFLRQEEVMAYLYLSRPISGISGIINLGKSVELMDWYHKYESNNIISKRVLTYRERGNKVVMPVVSYQETNTILKSKLEKQLGSFVVPQGFYYLEGSLLSTYLNDNLKSVEPRVYNDTFRFDDENEICRNYGLR